MARGKGRRAKGAAMRATSNKKTRRQAKRILSSPPGILASGGPSRTFEAEPTHDIQMGGEASMRDILLDIHSHLDAQQREMEYLKIARGRAPERTARPSASLPIPSTGGSSARH